MERTTEPDDDNPIDDDVLDPEVMTDVGNAHGLNSNRADRFYDRMRTSIQNALSRGKLEKSKEFLLFVPDIFILLWRLANDKRVAGKDKVLLGSALAYYVFPLDVIPEAVLGPIGYLDDLVFAVYVLNKLLGDIDESVLREHWSGSEDLLQVIRKVLGSADKLATTGFVSQIKKMMK
jgi:uncharacterized membrane protein YkvA (DUF1232 family)